MTDHQPRDKQVSPLRQVTGWWRFAVIMIANVWLVFVIMRYGTVRQPADATQPVNRYSRAATLIASVALVGGVLAIVVAVSHVCRGRRKQERRLAIYLERDEESRDCQ